MDTAAIHETLNKALSKLHPSGSWPVNVHGILSRLGVGLRFEDAQGKTPSHLQLGHTPTIIIYRQTPAPFLSTKERFSIAHELAHWIVWRRFGSVPSSETEYWLHETVCNDFAAKLLVAPRTLQDYIAQQVKDNVDPIYFPRNVAKSADVSWEVAAKSISALPSTNFAYLRLVKAPEVKPKEGKTPSAAYLRFKVNCSTLKNMPGSFIGRNAILRAPQEVLHWMDDLPLKTVNTQQLTLAGGNLSLNSVPCAVVREQYFWVINFCSSDEGVQVETSH
jgi:Zn-dependent peptidase ImmA (M78 family)